MQYKRVCFWNIPNGSDPGAADEVRSRIVPGWNETEEAKAVVAVMKSAEEQGKPTMRCKGMARDRLDGEILGSCDFSAGIFIFPQKWWKYIEKHSVKPWDEEFIQFCVSHVKAVI